jgi:hypothetical protein
MKNVTRIPGPSWIEYLLTLKMSPFIYKKVKLYRKPNIEDGE